MTSTAMDAYMRDIRSSRTELLTREQELETAAEIRQYWLPYKDRSNLTPEEMRLRRRGLKARDRMAEANIRLVVHVAKKYQRYLPLEDLVSEGSTGLMTAIDRFDPAKGCKFSTFATWWIMQAITRAVQNKSRIIRIPIHIRERFQSIKRAVREFQQREGRSPRTDQIAELLDKPEEWVRETLSYRDALSLNFKHPNAKGDDDCELGSIIPAETIDPIDYAIESEQCSQVAFLLSYLPEKWRRAMELRFGLIDGEMLPHSEVADRLNLSRARVQQIQTHALRRMRLIAQVYFEDNDMNALEQHLERWQAQAKRQVKEREDEELPRRTTAEMIAETRSVISDLQTKGIPFTKQEILAKARIDNKFLGRQQQLKREIDRAIADSKNFSPKTETPMETEPQYNPDPDRITELETQLRQAEERNAELRQQLQAAQVTLTPPIVVATPPAAWLRQQREIEQQTIDRIDREIEQALAAKSVIQRSLAAIDLLLSKVEPLEPEGRLTNGNGKHSTEVKS